LGLPTDLIGFTFVSSITKDTNTPLKSHCLPLEYRSPYNAIPDIALAIPDIELAIPEQFCQFNFVKHKLSIL
jgi:hypothetical protein